MKTKHPQLGYPNLLLIGCFSDLKDWKSSEILFRHVTPAVAPEGFRLFFGKPGAVGCHGGESGCQIDFGLFPFGWSRVGCRVRPDSLATGSASLPNAGRERPFHRAAMPNEKPHFRVNAPWAGAENGVLPKCPYLLSVCPGFRKLAGLAH